MNPNTITRASAKRLPYLLIMALVTGSALGVGLARATYVATFTVTKTADTNDGTCDADCSLREAIRAANANSGDDTIIIPSGVYTLTIAGAGEDAAATGDLDITGNLIINGAGAASTIIDGNGSVLNDRVFDNAGAFIVTISGVTVQNGNDVFFGGGIRNVGGTLTLSNSVVRNNSARFGGGLTNGSGTLTLNDSTVSGNVATTTDPVGGAGGGIENIGTLIMSNSTVSANVANNSIGGGIHNQGQVDATNSTISGNSATRNGGGIFNVVGPFNPTDGTITLNNVTIANNSTGGDGGGIIDCGTFCGGSPGTISLKNTIIAGNIDMTGTSNPDCAGTLNSQGYNLIQVVSAGCTITGTSTGNLIGVNPNLGPLQDNGGPTLTHALLAGSPAIDAGDNVGCPAIDQRGVARPQGAACDIGAYEFLASLAINYPSGMPGSFFTITGSNFPPSSTATIVVNGRVLSPTVPTNASGGFVFLLNTGQADAGRYFVTATVNPSATTSFVLAPDEPLRPQEGSGPVLTVPSGIAFTNTIYLPLIQR